MPEKEKKDVSTNFMIVKDASFKGLVKFQLPSYTYELWLDLSTPHCLLLIKALSLHTEK